MTVSPLGLINISANSSAGPLTLTGKLARLYNGIGLPYSKRYKEESIDGFSSPFSSSSSAPSILDITILIG